MIKSIPLEKINPDSYKNSPVLPYLNLYDPIFSTEIISAGFTPAFIGYETDNKKIIPVFFGNSFIKLINNNKVKNICGYILKQSYSSLFHVLYGLYKNRGADNPFYLFLSLILLITNKLGIETNKNLSAGKKIKSIINSALENPDLTNNDANEMELVKNITDHFSQLGKEELFYLATLNLRKKEILFNIKFINQSSDTYHIWTELARKFQLNRNSFSTLSEMIYELGIRETFPLIRSFITDEFPGVLEQDKPLNQKQRIIHDLIYNRVHPQFSDKENRIRSALKSAGIRNYQFQFTPYFEEKKFQIGFQFTKKNDIEQYKKESEKIISIFDSLWEDL